MPNFAVIQGNVVSNLLVGESKEDLESMLNLTCIEYSDDPLNMPHLGLKYENGIFEQPQVIGE